MHANRSMIPLLGFFALSGADPVTFTVGERKDYSVTGTFLPKPSGNTLEMFGEGKTEDGIDVALSDAMQKRIDDVMKKDCKEMNSDCFMKIRDIIDDKETELQSRFVPLVPLAVVAAVLAIGFEHWHLTNTVGRYEPVHLAPDVLSVASEMATATEIVVVPTGKPSSSITITASPQPTATGTQTATVTTFKDSADGHKKGDVGIIIPEDLAKLLDDYLGKQQTGTCLDGQAFSKKDRRRLSGLPGSVCGTELTMANNAMAGALLHVMATQAPPRIKGEAVRAMNQAIAFVRQHASILRMSSEQAVRVTEFLYPLVWQKMVNGKTIQGTNVIPEDAIDTDNSNESCDEDKRHTETNCKVGCKLVGALGLCSTSCAETTACMSTTAGYGSTTASITTTSIEPWTAIKPISTGKTIQPHPSCELNAPSDFGAQYFTDKVYGGFCHKVGKDKLEWTVDKDGKQISLNKRTPPPTHDNAQFTLKFEPSDDGQCDMSCDKAFSLMGATCSQQNNLAKGGSVDVTCGTYSFSLNRPPKKDGGDGDGGGGGGGNDGGDGMPYAAMKLREQQCFDASDHNDVPSYSDDSDWWNSVLKKACDNYDDKTAITPDTDVRTYPAGLWEHPIITTGASWMTDCKLKGGNSQNFKQPLPDDSSVTCRSLILNNYLKCNNGGGGGYISAGCVSYVFIPQYAKSIESPES
ncbi:hypothetical protein NUU61_009487 [Penicillium alfredii]|uniref:Uncharacterized protein n=1 Tax=Penicillium alfredii TaxID=1506179 RepID=A0A9W9EN48_9EURO|nr:uncharacterized protein NUU61_009487 [Penicillium alfredii]KAJ5084908.1 hypothetical protein NUU61_009487 [Penicillium alfredii]